MRPIPSMINGVAPPESGSPATQAAFSTWRVRSLLVAALFILALLVRLPNLNQPPLDFHATRQYRSLIIARGYYDQTRQDLPNWQREVAALNQERQGILEPPLMEFLVSGLYRLVGSEQYWIPKFLSVLYWLAGAFFLYKIACRLAGENAALFSSAFYLFLPFGILASRSFQPDPLMVMLMLASILAMLRQQERPSRLGWLAASLLSAAAVFVKPVSLFVLCVTFILLTAQKHGLRRTLRSPGVVLFLAITLLPAILFYVVYGMMISAGLQEQARSSFMPQLLLTPFFWRGWFENIQAVIGIPALVLSLLGLMLFRQGLPRLVILGLWAGYVTFCLVFDYHIATHDYYHLQIVPIAALSLGPVASVVYERLLELNRGWFWRTAIAAALMLGLVFALYAARPDLMDRGSQTTVQVAAQVGELVHHSPDTVFLASDYGLSLEYHGELSGQPWPLVSDLQWEQLAGQPSPAARERFQEWFAAAHPNYFIIMDLRELDQQQDLKAFLTQDFPLVAQGENFMIFDLRSR